MICILYGCTGSGKTWYLQNHLLEKIDHPLVYCSVLSSEREWRNKSVFSIEQLTLVTRLPEVLSLNVLDINDRYQLLAPIVTELLQLKNDYNFYICLSKYHNSLESLFKAAEHIVFFANSAGAITDLPQECLPGANALHEISEFIKYFDEHRAYSYYRGYYAIFTFSFTVNSLLNYYWSSKCLYAFAITFLNQRFIEYSRTCLHCICS